MDDAFATMKKEQTDAVIVLINAPPTTVPLALNNRIPAFSHHKSLAKTGAVVCYSADFSERGREYRRLRGQNTKGAQNQPICPYRNPF